MDTVSGSLAEGNNVYLRGFGSFIVKKRAEKTARNISRNTTIIIPEHFIGDITGDLNHKRGRIMSVSSENHMQVIQAEVPYAELFRYAAELRK